MNKSIKLFRHRIVRIYQSYFPEKLSTLEHAFLRKHLSEDLLALFYSQPLCDQRHGLLVFDKAKEIFASHSDLEEEELLIASLFHDVAKKDCRFNVTQRVLIATLLIFVDVKNRDLTSSKSKFARRIGVYANHSKLSWDLIKDQTNSDFVKVTTLYHHGVPGDVELSQTQSQFVDKFIEADTL